MAEPPVKKARVRFGDSDETEQTPVAASQVISEVQENGGISAAVLAGIKAGNINIDDGEL